MTDELKNYDVIYFSTTTCPPCKITKPIVEKVTNEENVNVKFYTIDQEENGRDVAVEFGVSSVPTMIFNKNGEEVFRKVGAVSEAQFKTMLENIN